MIRIGIMGATWPGRSHASGLSKLKGVRIEAVSDLSAEKRAAFVETFGELQQYSDYAEMLKKADLDAVVVGLPTGMHYDVSRDCLKRGLHVLCEKPPTTSASEMIRLAKLSEKQGLVYMFARQPRFQPEMLTARRLVQQGRIGHVYHAEARWIRCRGIPLGAGGWFVNKAKGGGVLLDLGVHSIDNAWFVMGCPRPVEVFAGLHCAFDHLAPKGIEYTAEDAAVGMIRFENGATLNLIVTFALNTAGLDAAKAEGAIRPEWGEVRIYGKKGGIDVFSGKLIKGRKKDVLVSGLPLPSKPVPVFEAQSKEFIRAIRKNEKPLNSPEQAVMLMQMLDALRKSGDTRRAIRIHNVL